jgi:hypothetical protein
MVFRGLPLGVTEANWRGGEGLPSLFRPWHPLPRSMEWRRAPSTAGSAASSQVSPSEGDTCIPFRGGELQGFRRTAGVRADRRGSGGPWGLGPEGGLNS